MKNNFVDKDLYESFIEETRENIEIIEAGILKLEKDPTNKDIVNEIFRRYHMIKGSSSFINYTKLSKFAHTIENLLEDVRSGHIKITDKIISFLINSVNILKSLIDNEDSDILIDFDNLNKQIEKIRKESTDFKENRFQYIKLDKQEEDEIEELKDTDRYLIFDIANVNFGINLSVVDEITRDIEGAKLPFVESYILKLINIRGELIPVVDLRTRFNLKFRNGKENKIIIVKYNNSQIGLRVDSVEKITKINDNQIKPFKKRLKDFNTDYIKGIYIYNNKPIIILNLEKILKRNEVKKDEQ